MEAWFWPFRDSESIRTTLAVPPSGLRSASTLCLTWGVLCGAGGVALIVYVARTEGFTRRAVLAILSCLLICAGYCSAGYLVRKQRRLGGWIGIATASVASAGYLLAHTPASWLGLVVNAGIIALLVTNWGELRSGAS